MITYVLWRGTIPKKCIKCLQIKPAIEFHKRKDSKDGLRNECKVCAVKRASLWSKENKNKRNQYLKDYYIENAEKIKKKSRKWRRDNPEKARLQDSLKSKTRCRKTENLRSREYRKNNPEKINARSAEYRNKKKCSGLYRAYRSEIRQFYKNCPEGFEVDHILPISHKLICGLHVPWNLQYLSKTDNRKKSNKFDGTNFNISWSIHA